LGLTQAQDFAGFEIYFNIVISWSGRQAWHGAHCPKQGIEKPGPDGRADIPDRHPEAFWNSLEGWVVA